MLLTALREVLNIDGEIKEIMRSSRALKWSHYKKIVDYLEDEEYSYARREIRIFVNQVKLNVIEMN